MVSGEREWIELTGVSQVRTETQNVAFTCVVNFCLNIYYGTLYAYTPEVLPSAHRGTGNGMAVAGNRVMGIMSAVIATYAGVSLPFRTLSRLVFPSSRFRGESVKYDLWSCRFG